MEAPTSPPPPNIRYDPISASPDEGNAAPKPGDQTADTERERPDDGCFLSGESLPIRLVIRRFVADFHCRLQGLRFGFFLRNGRQGALRRSDRGLPHKFVRTPIRLDGLVDRFPFDER